MDRPPSNLVLTANILSRNPESKSNGNISRIEIGGRLAPPPLSHHPACLLGTGRFQSTSISHSEIDRFGVKQACGLEPVQTHGAVGLGRIRQAPPSFARAAQFVGRVLGFAQALQKLGYRTSSFALFEAQATQSSP